MPDKYSAAIKLGGEALCQCIAEHGFSNTIDFLVRINKSDWMLDELLILAPGLSATSDFLKRLTSYKCDDEEVFRDMIKQGHLL